MNFGIDDGILNDYRRRAAAAAAALRDAYDGSQAARQERAELTAQHHRNRENLGYVEPHQADVQRLAKLDRDLETYVADERKLQPALDYNNALFGIVRDHAREHGHDLVR